MSDTHKTIYAKDYRAPDWLVPDIALDFALDAKVTSVRARLNVQRNGAYDRPLRLDGDGLSALEVLVDGAPANYEMDGPTLVLHLTGDAHEVETRVEISP
ncbi:MAG: aminopeptidase N, partial [Alphaproteobacteria bacterium]|nr:aminopeptidase N [Alphaproteobacteria bacterium]